MTHVINRASNADKIFEASKELTQIFILLYSDVSVCSDRIAEFNQDTPMILKQFWYRAYIRALFSWIEGTVYRMKQLALEFNGVMDKTPFTPGELIILTEESYKLTDQGKIEPEKNKFPATIGNILFALRIYARTHNVDFPIDLGKPPWQDQWGRFKKVAKIRNRMIHPKTVAEISFSEEEIKEALKTGSWFHTMLEELMKKADESSDAFIEQSERELNEAIHQALAGRKDAGNLSETSAEEERRAFKKALQEVAAKINKENIY